MRVNLFPLWGAVLLIPGSIFIPFRVMELGKERCNDGVMKRRAKYIMSGLLPSHE